jgi:hypothetical protein
MDERTEKEKTSQRSHQLQFKKYYLEKIQHFAVPRK